MGAPRAAREATHTRALWQYPIVERLLTTEDQLQAKRKELEAAVDAVERKVEATQASLETLASAQ